jgi:hypothetical protein
MKTIKRLIFFATAAIGAMAVIDQMTRPEAERTWHGDIFGVPYDFRPLTFERLQSRLWNPDDPRLFTPHAFGVGWTVNFHRLAKLITKTNDEDVVYGDDV